MPLSFYVFIALAATACAHSNGMDMSMDGAMDLSAGEMLPWLHFTPGDILWFYGWVPSSTGAMVGTCIGLFLLGLVDRWIAACRAMMEAHWSKRAQIVQADRLNLPSSGEKKPSTVFPGRVRDAVTMRSGPPFILSHDVTRGITHAIQAALHFAIMLVVMTYQVGFIISIIVGLGVGEALFGRFASHAGHH
ncbi:CTR copper uptake transporter [Lentinus tigrinus ALCF2SS1-7]|uniref:Copper transport protein n=1 Tax=Lentinus tigrinus ALCF2SS1-6 TaxID=1328759 RepID=A0A5C2RNZ5_9APHY|nr:CTR copper uptake transporter [Lentinus tigrinus ALCF2SS1-6]RPD72709.1 CTR copper uptake transporter [Lentinus tigrinus ALCF2SS1-7]